MFAYGESNQHELCGIYLDGLFSSNYLNTLKSLLATFDRLIDEWKQIRGDWGRTKEFLNNKKFAMFYAKLRQCFSTMYYWGTTDTTNLLMGEINSDRSVVENLVLFIELTNVVLFFVFYFWIVSALGSVMVQYYSVLKILPLGLINKNKLLTRKLDLAFQGGSLV